MHEGSNFSTPLPMLVIFCFCFNSNHVYFTVAGIWGVSSLGLLQTMLIRALLCLFPRADENTFPLAIYLELGLLTGHVHAQL